MAVSSFVGSTLLRFTPASVRTRRTSVSLLAAFLALVILQIGLLTTMGGPGPAAEPDALLATVSP